MASRMFSLMCSSSFWCHLLLLLASSIDVGTAHGSINMPKPRNSDPTTRTIEYGVKMRIVDGGVAWDDFNVHTCVGGYQTAAEFKWDACNPATHHGGLAYQVSRSQPASAKDIVDCTPHNVCNGTTRRRSLSERLSDMASSDTIWLSAYSQGDCNSQPAVAYKMTIDACTQFPVSGKNYWTGGCQGYACMWFSQGCCIGCPHCTGDTGIFFRSVCDSTKAPTLTNPKYRTFNRYNKDPHGDWTSSHPWRAPGSAPVLDACGVAGGFLKNNEGPGGHPPPGHSWGDKGSELPVAESTLWKTGSTVEVSWSIAANHGGGYQYRLCPKSESITEDCFQRMPLSFADAAQTLILGNGSSIEFEGTFVSTGTLPEASVWAMNPVPACGDAVAHAGPKCDYPQFPPPAGCDETCWGDSDESPQLLRHHTSLPTIVDHLKVPASLEPGDYVLGWRWDSEQTPQVWASCSDITIVSNKGVWV